MYLNSLCENLPRNLYYDRIKDLKLSVVIHSYF